MTIERSLPWPRRSALPGARPRSRPGNSAAPRARGRARAKLPLPDGRRAADNQHHRRRSPAGRICPGRRSRNCGWPQGLWCRRLSWGIFFQQGQGKQKAVMAWTLLCTGNKETASINIALSQASPSGIQERGIREGGTSKGPPWGSPLPMSSSVNQLPSPQHFLYFLPLPQGQGSLRPTLGSSRR